uniref:RAP domain-containing protein n=1 Tax=Tetradesmus obliquus TaxID=3088 RepID=A0A383WLN5_TETOB|eukprot:jgi/Sobl393_1/11293/SZX78321.1
MSALILVSEVVTPLSSSSSSSGSSSSIDGPAAAARARAVCNLRHGSRRGALLKTRVAQRRYRVRKAAAAGQPRHISISTSPEDPSFAAKLASEISNCSEPRQLRKLLQDCGSHLTAAHCAAAISHLAGMMAAQQVQQQQQQQQQFQEAYHVPAAMAAELLAAHMEQASVTDCARAIYSLARLQLHRPALLKAAADRSSSGQLSAATPHALACLAAGLAHWGYAPHEAWQQQLCDEAAAQMSGFTAQDLANLMFALAVWRRPLSQSFLQRCLTAFRGHWGSADCHAPALLRFIFALTQLPPCLPEGQPGMLQAAAESAGHVHQHQQQQQQQRQQQQCGGQELARLLWGFAELRCWPGQAWMDDWLAAMQQQLGTMHPADLADTVWALARLRYTPPEPWMQTLAASITKTLPEFSAQGLAMVIWGFSHLGLRPERQWLLRFSCAAGDAYEEGSAQRLGQFVAGLLAQQNRQRFSAQGRLQRLALG